MDEADAGDEGFDDVDLLQRRDDQQLQTQLPEQAQAVFGRFVGATAEGLMLVTFPHWDEPSSKLKKLETVLRDAGKKPGGFGEMLAVTAVVALTSAIDKVNGPVTGEKLRDALEGLGAIDNPYVDGRFSFSKDSHEGFADDALKTIVVKNGKFLGAGGAR